MGAGVYKIESPSGNFYIGSSVNLRKRITQHKRDLRVGKHINTALQNAANKYGVEALNFSLIACALDNKYVRDIEQILIDDLKPKYNISKNAYSAIFDQKVISKRIKSISRPVIRLTDGARFDSAYEAARQMGAFKQRDLFPTAIKNGWKWANHFWKYEGSNITLGELEDEWNRREILRIQNAKQGATKAKSKKVICLLTGEVFGSCREAENKKNIYKGGVSNACLKNKKVGGSFWSFFANGAQEVAHA